MFFSSHLDHKNEASIFLLESNTFLLLKIYFFGYFSEEIRIFIPSTSTRFTSLSRSYIHAHIVGVQLNHSKAWFTLTNLVANGYLHGDLCLQPTVVKRRDL